VAEASVPETPPRDAEPASGVTGELVRRRWDEVVANIGSPVTRALVGPNAQVVSLDGGALRLGFASAGMARTFVQPRHVGAVEESVYQTLGVRVRVEAMLDERPFAPQGPRQDAPDPSPAEADAGGWPAVTPPGSAAAHHGPSVASASVSTGTSRGVSAAVGTVTTPRGGVAVAERTALAAEAPAPARERPAAAAASSATPSTAADDADAAWLAGVPLSEPPPDPEDPPEPSPEDVPPSRVAHAHRNPASSGAPAGPQVRETPRQAAERQVRESRSQAPAPSVEDGRADEYDEPSADDPDIASTGLVGVPLVVQVLGGKIIDEVTEDPA
jgi:DNA polymerase-3 subunit gamma/tau